MNDPLKRLQFMYDNCADKEDREVIKVVMQIVNEKLSSSLQEMDDSNEESLGSSMDI